MKARIKNLYEIIAGAILSLLCCNSCEGGLTIIDGPVEYGMPHATFTVIGDVKSEETGNPIEGISIKYRRWSEEQGFVDDCQFLSGKDGKVNEKFSAWPDVEYISLTFEDIDGEENGGTFAPDTLQKKDLKIEFVEDKNFYWHKGYYTITFEAKLKKETPAE